MFPCSGWDFLRVLLSDYTAISSQWSSQCCSQLHCSGKHTALHLALQSWKRRIIKGATLHMHIDVLVYDIFALSFLYMQSG